ncbi:tetratricopeptide repeat protein [Neorhodopirellula lusitana]|uniref:tetratricopeptide repeat protein n=1 Tax=Neorhodopirellula lusitana TaxID=445327 RepID=UPI0038502029
MIATRTLTATAIFLLVSLVAGNASAQTDRLYPVDGEVVIGKIKTISKEGVIITASGKDQTFAAGDIQRVLFQGDPPELTRGRDFILDGQYDQAYDQLKQLDMANISRDDIRSDAQFYLALSQGEMSLAGQGDLTKSTQAALGFVKQNPQSWHFYDTTRLLGDLAKAMGNYEKAALFYGYMRGAPSLDMKVESVYQGGLVKLAQGDLAGAKEDLSKVAGMKPTTVESKRLQTLSKASLAVVAAKEGQAQQAIEMVNDLIKTLNPADTATAARIYNALGASYAAAGKDEDAILAYLHTQLMYSMQAATHVEALKELAQLWTKVGKPDRAAQARGELQKRYPGLSG